jgi:nicotinamide-nucleotide adenylyltransferase
MVIIPWRKKQFRSSDPHVLGGGSFICLIPFLKKSAKIEIKIINSFFMPAKKPKRVAFVGRFQPFHRGHLSVIQDLLPKFDQVIVVVGSSDKFRTVENPFTVGERHAMVKATLEDLGVHKDKFKVVPLPDIDDDEKWVGHVVETCPEFVSIAITENPHVEKLFKKDKRKKIHKAKKKYAISGTTVREEIGKGSDLKKYLPLPVIAFLQKIGAARKIVDIVEEMESEDEN